MSKSSEEFFTEFPVQVAELEGHTLTIEVSDGQAPHGSPPGCLEVWLRRPPEADGKPGALMNNQAICQFFKNFDGDEEITETQAERNALRKEVADLKQTERELRKRVGQLNARVKGLEEQVAKDRKDVLRELAETQLVALKAKLDRLPVAAKVVPVPPKDK